MVKRDYIKIKVSDLKGYEKNNKKHGTNVDEIVKSIQANTYIAPIIIDENNVILAGHGRKLALDKLQVSEAEVLQVSGLSEEQKRDFRIRDNKLTELSEWDFENIKFELDALDNKEINDLFDGVFDDLITTDEEKKEKIEEDEAPQVQENAKIVESGDLFILGNHRLMCGDSTSVTDIEELMNGEKADLVFTDPPYGMKKENEGVLNDNLNFDDLLKFNQEWIPLSFMYLKDNGSRYCRGIDEPLMDIYSNILKPMQENNQLTFRNLITRDKGSGQGQLAEGYRMYPIADEKCLFVMCGVQGFNNNSDNYFEARDPIRLYLEDEAKKSGLNAKKLQEICGVGMRGHRFSKSQRQLITEEHYLKIQSYYGSDFFKKQYNEIKKQYNEIKKQYNETRAYFDNLHDNQNNVRHFKRTSGQERALTGGHATPKPLELCARAIKSSSRTDESVLDLFGGSGSTLIACEQLNRKCFMLELDPRYCEVIIKRFHKINPDAEIKCLNRDIDLTILFDE